MHQSRKGIFVYKYDFYGFDPILSYMINVTRERFRVAPVLCDAMTRCSRSRGSTTLSIITCFRGFEDINVHLVHQHVIYFLLPHEEHPIYKSFARPGHMEKSAMLERKLHSETSKTTKQNNSYQLSLTCLWFGSFLQSGMVDFVPGKWGRIQKTLDNIVLDFLSSVVLLFSLLHDLSFGVQLWPGRYSQRLTI